MLCLTDGSRFARTLTTAVASSRLDDVERDLWQVFHHTNPIVLANAPWGDFWWRGVVTENAPASQFDALAASAMSAFRFPGAIAAVAGTCPAFRGFHQRAWECTEGNLHLAGAIPLRGWTAHSALLIGLVPTLAVRDAIIKVSDGRLVPGIKWFNDLYLPGGKVAGALTRTTIIGNDADLLVIGIGVNAARAPRITPSAFVPGTAAAHVDLRTLLEEILHAIECRIAAGSGGGVAAMVEEYRSASTVVGRDVRVYGDEVSEATPAAEWPRPLASGVVLGIRDDLSLVIDGAAGPVSGGRLAFEQDCRAFGLPHP